MPTRTVLSALLWAALSVAAGSCTDRRLPAEPAIDPSPPAPAERITGEAVVPNPGNESPPRDPFSPYSTGPGPTWSYEDLTADEKIVADKGRDARAWQPINDAFSRASAELAQHAAAEAAEHQLGLDSLAGLGVVP